MAGNTVSIMTVTTQGRGGRNRETLPRSSKDFVLSLATNTRFKCTKCNTYIPKSCGYTELDNKCPYCHIKGFITEVPRTHKYNLENLKSKIEGFLVMVTSISRNDLAKKLCIPQYICNLICRNLSQDLKNRLRHGNSKAK